jgi:preprotein translocase subunit SecE
MAREAQLGGSAPRPKPEPRPVGEVQPRHRGGLLGFIAESWAELQKVEWPTQNQLIQGTAVVLIACLIVGIFLYINDEIWKQVVQKLLLGQ